MSKEISFKSILTKLINKEELSSQETELALDQILNNNVDSCVIGAFLALLRSKGESPIEIAGFVKSMHKACIPVILDRTVTKDLLDIVGTGGDGADTINISTASIVLASACGCKIAKAGNRSVSSRCGSADVLETLGVKIELNPSQVAQSIERCGIGFMYAPTNHPAMKAVAPIRKSLGIRTAFNLLGPLTNAAKANRVVIGVFDENLVDLMANTLMEVGIVDHGVVVHGCGLDEISPLGSSTIFEIKSVDNDNSECKDSKRQYITQKYQFDPLTEVNIPRCRIEDLKGGDPEENAQEFIKVLEKGNYSNAKRDAIILNAGVGVYVYGLASSIAEGCELARKVLYSGDAATKLTEWIQISQDINNNL